MKLKLAGMGSTQLLRSGIGNLKKMSQMGFCDLM
jgi:hypothetical protein